MEKMKPEYRSDVTVELVKASAEDNDVVYSAKVSTQGEQSAENINKQADIGLINYLMKNRHGTPFEHNSMTFMISAPLFVFREFHRHRVGWSYNEESGRYRQLKPVFYIPSENRNLVQTGKTGHYTFVKGTREQTLLAQGAIEDSCHKAYENYQAMLDAGIAKEIARSVLPVATYSTMYATCNARSLMSFLSLRTTNESSMFPSYPQYEIELVAKQMEEHWEKLMPETAAAFNKNGRVAP